MIRSILVPLDGSSFSEQALPLALAVAKRAGAKVESNISRVVLQGEVVPLIRTRLDHGEIDLVVMTTHGRGTLGRVWLGSVADELVRTTTAPILLVPPTRTETDFGVEPPLKNILVPLDGSPLAEQILEPAVALASGSDAAFTLFRVVRPTLYGGSAVEGATLDEKTAKMIDVVQTIEERGRREALDYLERIAVSLRKRGLRVRIEIAVDDQPGHAILGAAVAPDVDLIAMETHGRRGLARFFLGSVADKVLRGGSLPMLIHRPKT